VNMWGKIYVHSFPDPTSVLYLKYSLVFKLYFHVTLPFMQKFPFS
jgi:hypothetical protein